MKIYKQGEVELHFFFDQQIKDFTKITKEDVTKQQFILDYGVHGEMGIDLVKINAAILTVTIPQMSDEIAGFEAAYKVQMTGIIGVMLMLKTPKKDIFFPVSFLQGRPEEIFGEKADYYKYTIVATDQWSIPKV
jgi:hypothetical protein